MQPGPQQATDRQRSTAQELGTPEMQDEEGTTHLSISQRMKKELQVSASQTKAEEEEGNTNLST